MRPTRPALAVVALLAAACAAPAATRAPDPATCASDFARYDRAVRHYGSNASFDDDYGVIPPAALSRPIGALRRDGCLTFSADIDAMETLAPGLTSYVIVDSGPMIRATPVHLGIVTSIADEARATRFFRGLGYRSRGIGAEGLGRRLYIGPFTTQGALDQALQTARDVGFIAPYAARYTKF